VTGKCAYLGCGKPTGLRREGFCAEHRDLVTSAHTSLDAERVEDQ
jgi:hypothetical protein